MSSTVRPRHNLRTAAVAKTDDDDDDDDDGDDDDDDDDGDDGDDDDDRASDVETASSDNENVSSSASDNDDDNDDDSDGSYTDDTDDNEDEDVPESQSRSNPASAAAAAAAVAAVAAAASAVSVEQDQVDDAPASLSPQSPYYPHSFGTTRSSELLERTGPLSRAVCSAFLVPFRSSTAAAPVFAACAARPRTQLMARSAAAGPSGLNVEEGALISASNTGTLNSAAMASLINLIRDSGSTGDSGGAGGGGGGGATGNAAAEQGGSPRGAVGRQLDELRRRRTKATRALQQKLYDTSRRTDTQPVIVWFADNSCEQLDVSLDITALDLLYLLGDVMRLEWPELFALCEVELNGGEPRWLPMDKPLQALGLDLAQSQRRLQCRIKYERRAIDRVYKDARLVRLATLQARDCILSGAWPCTEPVAVRLAAYQIQAELGDHDPSLHRVGHVAKIGLEHFLPLPLLSNRQESDVYWEERLTSLHQQHRGLASNDAYVQYLDECRRSVPLFGSHRFDKATPVVSVVCDGVVEFLDAVRYRFYAFEQLRSWKCRGNVVEIGVVPKKSEAVDDGGDDDDDEDDDSVRSALDDDDDADDDDKVAAVPTPREKLFSIQCVSERQARELVELLTGFFVTGGGVQSTRAIKGVDVEQMWLPPTVLFKPMWSDGARMSALLNGDNAATSRLREALLHYRRECATRHVLPLQALLSAIDRALDHNLVLRSLALSGVGLDDKGFELVAAALATPAVNLEDNLALTSLDISRNALSPDSADAIVRLLAASPHLRHIDLSHNKLTSYGVMPTLPALAKLARLSSLRLAANQISNKGVTALANTLKANGALRLLDLSDNKVGDKAVASLATLIQSRAGMALDLSRNRIGPHGVEILMTALTVAMMTGGSLAELNIAQNAFGNKGMACVATAMAGNAPIARLDLSHNKLSEQSGVEFGRVLGKCKTVLALAVAGNQLGRKGWRSLTGGLALNHTLLTLDLASCDLDRYSVGLVCTAAQQGGVLESLSLRGNALGVDATRAVCTLISKSPSLLHLDIGESHLQSKDVTMLAESLVGHPTLISLDVSRAHLSALDVQFLAEALASNRSLHRIVLDGNALRDDGAAKLFAGLARNRSLQRVSLRQCRLTNLICPDVLSLGLANAFLRVLDMTENDVTDAERVAMVRQVNARPALTQIQL